MDGRETGAGIDADRSGHEPRGTCTSTRRNAAPGPPSSLHRLLLALAPVGPGLVVMLADTDVGSVVTAAQSGAHWGFRLLWLQLLLVPVLYVVQELTVRLGVHTGKGHGELIRKTFGARWAWISVSGLVVTCVGALITEFSGIVGVGVLFGVPPAVSLALATAMLLGVVYTGSYVRVERVALFLGAFEIAFVAVAIYAHPRAGVLLRQFASVPLGDPGYLYLVAANIGAVIMPWMVFYQQSAVIDKGLGRRDLRAARWDTAIGSVVTQIVMIAIIVAAAVALGHTHGERPTLDTVGQIYQALSPVLGDRFGRIAFALGVLGAAMVAAIVVSLAAAWGLGEVTGYRRSLSQHPRRAPWFYVVYTVAVVAGAITVGLATNLVALSIAVEVLNALLLPLVLGLLLALVLRALPHGLRPRGAYGALVIGVIVVTSVLGIASGIIGALLLGR
ncbi:MAG TPA: divalent metal cation transporter [Gammaproteobacteria bacterium]|nr:divalent metal cation transporter [Gammaproteobacteria bacterium]